ncbi:MAG: SMP-30/gluconolactonase/LRE family protein [Dysgonamonadaceae bacterium]|jgi:sugar lactone lactonase YvrE|nr:SMP-30/gluconolactonase/LRE family protein [Dysgonamonadaceae bacterium]
MKRRFLVIILLCLAVARLQGAEDKRNAWSSVYSERPDDPLSVYFTPDKFNTATDGSLDVSDALQEAIDRVQETVRYGILFIPEGTYRISRTINVWKGIRLIGYGKKRPVFVLAKNTADFDTGEGKYMFRFCSDRPRGNRPIQDANAGTFYSGMRNINLRIEQGNSAAVAVRFHVAQHCFLSYIDFYLSEGNIGIEDGGNEIEFCRFFGGDYGIKTGKTSPGWQFLVLDSYFENQKRAAIETREAGLTIIRANIRKTPSAVIIRDGYPEELWISDSRFEEIKNEAIHISNENNPRTEINAENISLINTPVFAKLGDSGKVFENPYKYAIVSEFSHGLQINSLGETGEISSIFELKASKSAPSLVSTDIPLVPDNSQWINLKSLGAKGDGQNDDTQILNHAIENHQIIYLPSGHYRVSEPIVLKPNTILIGLHPSITQIILKDSAEAWQGAGPPLPLLETPKGGTNIVTGIGLNTAGVNPRAVAAKWMAGENSLMNDVRFVGGHGTYTLNGRDIPVYNDNRTADGIRYRNWDVQYPSLWVTESGGGSFKDIWTPSPYASEGMYISNTSTSGRIYYMSSEHHVRNEIVLDNVQNWRFFGLQLEEESGEGPYCLPLDIRNSSNLLFTNTFLYRVSRITTSFPYAIRVENVSHIGFKGLHNYSWTKHPFENSIFDMSSGNYVRPREFARFVLSSETPKKNYYSRAKKLADGFGFIDAAVADERGNIYFSDSKAHHIYRYNTDSKITLLCNLPTNPTALAVDKNGWIIAITRVVSAPSIHTRGEINAISFDPENPLTTLIALKEKNIEEIDNNVLLYFQTTKHQNENNLPRALVEKPKTCFLSADGSVAIPNTSDIGQTYSLKQAHRNNYFYVSTSPGLRTYRCTVSSDGKSLTEPHLFAESGAVDVAIDDTGKVYIPADNIKIFDENGILIDEIPTPERPINILFGGKNEKKLYFFSSSAFFVVD